MSFNLKIRQLRKERKASADVLASFVGYSSRQGIYDIESGKIQRISNEMLKKFAEFFSVPISFFYDDIPNITEAEAFYKPDRKIDNLTVSADNMAQLIEENRSLWRENALLKTILIENKIEVKFS